MTLISTETYSIELACYLLVGTENGQTNTFYWQFNSQTLSGGRYSIVSDSTSTKLTISNLAASDKGYYYCFASNSYGVASRNTQLKVKSEHFEEFNLFTL